MHPSAPGATPRAASASSPQVLPVGTSPQVVHRFFEFSLLGMLSVGFLAVLVTGFLDPLSIALTTAILLVRLALVMGWLRLKIPPRVITALAFLYAGFFAVDFQYLSHSFLVATIHLMLFLAALKLLTASSARDYGYLMLIAVLELVAAAVLASSASFLFFLTVFMLFAIAAMVGSEVRFASGARVVVARAGLLAFPRRITLLSLGLFAGIAIMTAALFFVLPRTARVALGRFVPARYRISGFSNSVTLGEIGEIKQSNAPMLRVRSFQSDGFMPVRWRGSSLSQFDGKRWFNPDGRERVVKVDDGKVTVRSIQRGAHPGHNLIYRAHVEPIAAETLFFAGTPETIQIGVPLLRYTNDGTFRVPPRYSGQGLDYSVYGFLSDELSPERATDLVLTGKSRAELLSVPVLDPRIEPLAQSMTSGASSEIERARLLEKHLREDYGYTLELLSKPVEDPLAYFLFQRRKGHCEYFASAMTIMLRTLGIPSRMATGFQSGTFNPITGWQVVRASDAHSWVEAWIDGRGWTTFDPTPSDPSAAAPIFLSRLQMLSDAAQQYWQDWVVSYDLTRQVEIASRLQARTREFKLPDFAAWGSALRQAGNAAWKYAAALAALLGAVVLVLAALPRLLRWWNHRERSRRVATGGALKSDATLLYEQLLEVLARRGIEKPLWLTPLEFARVIPNSPAAPLVYDATRAYNELRFGGKPDAALHMMHALEKIRQLQP